MRGPLRGGPQTGSYERRYLFGEMPSPGGINSQVNPAQVKPYQFTRLENIRWLPDGVRPRGGQARMNIDGPIHALNAAIHPAQFITATPKKNWNVGDGCPGESVGVGFYLGHYDSDQEPQLQRAAWYQAATGSLAFGMYGGVPHVAVGTSLRRLQVVDVDWGLENIVLAGESQDVPLDTLPAYAHAMLEWDGVLFICCNDGSIQTWDGKTLRQDLAPVGADIPVALCPFRDSLLVGYHTAANKLSIRQPGFSPGTYAHMPPTIGNMATKPGLNSMVSYRDIAYGATDSTRVWKYDGTTLDCNFKIFGGARVETVAEAFGYLYVGHDESGPRGAELARYDGSVWEDTHKDFVAQPGLSAATRVAALNYFKGRLAAGLMVTTQPSRVALSPGEDTAGTYEVHATAGTTPSEMRYFVAG